MCMACNATEVTLICVVWDVSERLAWLHILLEPKAMFMVCAFTRNYAEAHDPYSR